MKYPLTFQYIYATQATQATMDFSGLFLASIFLMATAGAAMLFLRQPMRETADVEARIKAVAVLIKFKNDGVDYVVVQVRQYVRIGKSKIAIPGGAKEAGYTGKETAVKEVKEECGFHIAESELTLVKVNSDGTAFYLVEMSEIPKATGPGKGHAFEVACLANDSDDLKFSNPVSYDIEDKLKLAPRTYGAPLNVINHPELWEKSKDGMKACLEMVG